MRDIFEATERRLERTADVGDTADEGLMMRDT
jgi:hypothetical protein